MARRVTILALTIAIVLTLALLGSQSRQHAGRVVEAETNRPLSAAVNAYNSVPIRELRGEPCPEYPGRLDAKVANRQGAFSLGIPEQQQAYSLVVCMNAYFPRVEPIVDNSVNGSPVQPVPLEMYPTAHKDQLPAATSRKLSRVLSDLRYYQSIDREAVDRAIRDWGERSHESRLADALLQALEKPTFH